MEVHTLKTLCTEEFAWMDNVGSLDRVCSAAERDIQKNFEESQQYSIVENLGQTLNMLEQEINIAKRGIQGIF